MNLRLLRSVAGMLIISAVLCFNLNGQTRSDVIKVYNEGAKTVKTDVNVSIEAFENVIKLAAEVGETMMISGTGHKFYRIASDLHLMRSVKMATELIGHQD